MNANEHESDSYKKTICQNIGQLDLLAILCLPTGYDKIRSL